ncbi:MAG: molybdenum cofactor guanylyltransferase MobA [Pseudomonadota bacterium]
MAGRDKGLQRWRGEPLARHALRRLQPQVGRIAISANRHLDDYRAFGVPVWADTLPGYAGPLAGWLSGLRHCETPYLVSVPCDTPGFPTDLVERLAHALADAQADLAMARTAERLQPVFCLLRGSLADSLQQYLESGERKVQRWAARHRRVEVPFDDGDAFRNLNTLDDLERL